MALARTAKAFYALLRALSARSQNEAAALWAEIDKNRLAQSWTQDQIGERLFVAVSTAQATAAAAAEQYVSAAIADQAAAALAESALSPTAFAGIASDGRDLEDLLFQPVIRALTAIKGGASTEDALAMGLSALQTISSTQVSDAGRAATDVAMTAVPEVTGWVRMLNPPSCGRCAILAGRNYRWSQGFERHERCDCIHVPAIEDVADDIRTDPEAYFESLTGSEQDKYFGKAGAEAIRSGANIGQVVNARRGAAGLSQPGRLTEAEQTMLRGGRKRGHLDRVDVYGRQVQVTTEGTTVRGIAGQRLGAVNGVEKRAGERLRRAKTPRLMPEAISEIANGDREENIRLLKRFGYIV